MIIIKNILATTLLATLSIQSHAAYEVVIKVPDIHMVKMVKLVAHTPLLGDWIDKGLPINCSAWTPLPSTVKKDQTFEQSSTCSQEQTRTVEEQVKNLDTGVISKTGNKSEESQNISIGKKQSSVGTKAPVKECVHNSNWGAGFWLEQPNNTVYFVWYGPSPEANEYLNKTLPTIVTTYSQGGYTYTRGAYKSTSPVSGKYYEICRE
jgi:hypothetical protein